MKRSKRIISILVAAAILITLVPASAFALFSKPELNYLAIGASNTNGFGLTGFMDWAEENIIPDDEKTDGKYFNQLKYYCYPNKYRSAGNSATGFDNTGANSYPKLLAEALGATYDVNLKQYAQCGMRFEDLRFILDDSYPGDSYTAWRFYSKEEDYPIDWLSEDYRARIIPVTDNSYYEGWFVDVEYQLNSNEALTNANLGLPNLKKAYKDAIKEADLITLDLGINSFGPYLEEAIFDNRLEPSEDIKLITPSLLTKAREEVIKLVVDNIDSISKEDINSVLQYIDALVYAYASYQVNLVKCLDAIRELNKNAEIVILGMDNIMDDIDISLAGIKIPAGKILSAVIVSENALADAYALTHSKCTFVPTTMVGGVETLREQFLNEYTKNLDANGFLKTDSELFKLASEWFNVYDNDILLGRRTIYEVTRCNRHETNEEIWWSSIGYSPITKYDLEDTLDQVTTANNVAIKVLARMLYEAIQEDAIDIVTIVEDNGEFRRVFPGGYLKKDSTERPGYYMDPRDLVDEIAAAAVKGDSPAKIYSNLHTMFTSCPAFTGEALNGLKVWHQMSPETQAEITKEKVMDAEYTFFFTMAMGNCIMLHPSEEGHREYRDLILKTLSLTASTCQLRKAASKGLKVAPVIDFTNETVEPFVDYLKEQVKNRHN